MDLHEHIRSCASFATGKCPHQRLMEKVYLVPQLMKPQELEMCERLLRACESGSPVACNP
jgi:hypothetical protein